MTVIIIQTGEVHIIASVKVTRDAVEIFCLDTKTGLSYKEHLPDFKFVPRIRKTNKRVYMSPTVIRVAIAGAQPVDAKLSIANVYDSDDGSDNESSDADREPQQRTVLALKYHIGVTRTVLNWQWHLTPISLDLFYQALVKDTLHAASYLNGNVDELVDVIKKKDIEIKQYRLEGAKLRRTTVVTDTFDETAYQVKHKAIMDEVSNYGDVNRALYGIKREMPVVPTPADKVKRKRNASLLMHKSNAQSKRSRKRKALESKSKHVELKAKQRRIKPQMQYKDSQSQEDDLNAILKIDDEAEHVKPKLGLGAVSNKVLKVDVKKKVLNYKEDDDNIFDIMAMIDTTVQQSVKVFNYAKQGK